MYIHRAILHCVTEMVDQSEELQNLRLRTGIGAVRTNRPMTDHAAPVSPADQALRTASISQAHSKLWNNERCSFPPTRLRGFEGKSNYYGKPFRPGSASKCSRFLGEVIRNCSSLALPCLNLCDC
jgi:hypothetical protein